LKEKKISWSTSKAEDLGVGKKRKNDDGGRQEQKETQKRNCRSNVVLWGIPFQHHV
jgi:hypothetical protein